MAIQTINVGNLVNDGLGDDLRTAFLKVNANFAELSTTSTTTVSNIGSVGVGLFKRKTGADLEFKKISAGDKIAVTEGQDTVVITNTEPDAFTRVITSAGIVTADRTSTTALTIQGGTNISVSAQGSVVTVGETINTIKLISTVDFGTITGEYENAIQFILAAGDYDFGTFNVGSEFDYDAGTL